MSEEDRVIVLPETPDDSKLRERSTQESEEVLVDERESAFLEWLEDEDDVRTAEIEESFHARSDRYRGGRDDYYRPPPPPSMRNPGLGRGGSRGGGRGGGYRGRRGRGGGGGSSWRGRGSVRHSQKDFLMGQGASAAAHFLPLGTPFDMDSLHQVVQAHSVNAMTQNLARLGIAYPGRPMDMSSSSMGVSGTSMTAPIPSIPMSLATSGITPHHPSSSMFTSLMQSSVANSLGSMDSGGGATGAAAMFAAPMMAGAHPAPAPVSVAPASSAAAAVSAGVARPSYPVRTAAASSAAAPVSTSAAAGRPGLRAPPPGLPTHVAASSIRTAQMNPGRVDEYRSQNDMLDQRRRHLAYARESGRVDESFGRHSRVAKQPDSHARHMVSSPRESRGMVTPVVVTAAARPAAGMSRSHSGSSSGSSGSTSPPPLSASERSVLEARFESFLVRNQPQLQGLLNQLEEARPMDGESIIRKASNLILARNSRESIQRALHRDDPAQLGELFMFGLRNLQLYWSKREEFIRSRSSGHIRETTPPGRDDLMDDRSRSSVRRGRTEGAAVATAPAPVAPVSPVPSIERVKVAIVSYCVPDRDQASLVGAMALSYSLWECGSKLFKICLVPESTKETELLWHYFDLVVPCQDFDPNVYPLHYFALFSLSEEVSRRAETVLFVPPQACFVGDSPDERVESLYSHTRWADECGLRLVGDSHCSSMMIYLQSDPKLYSILASHLLARRVVINQTELMEWMQRVHQSGQWRDSLSDCLSVKQVSNESTTVSSSTTDIPNVVLYSTTKVFELGKDISDSWIEFWFALCTKLAIHNPGAYLVTFALQPEFNERLSVDKCARLQSLIRSSKPRLSELYRTLVMSSQQSDKEEAAQMKDDDRKEEEVSTKPVFPPIDTTSRVKSRLRIRPSTPETESDSSED